MACFSCSQKTTYQAPQIATPQVCTNTRVEIEDLIVKINCRKQLYPSAKMNGAFNVLLEMLETEVYCKYNLTPIYQLISEFPNVC
jgi:hypothetical protein